MTVEHCFDSVGVMWHDFPPGRISAQAKLVEDAGFDGIWVGDHLLSYVDGLVAASAMAAATSTITVGTAVYLIPLRPVASVVRSLITVQRESESRLIFGVGLGGDDPNEYSAVNVNMAGRALQLDQALSELSHMFASGTTSGGHALRDMPATGSPPVWVGGRSSAAARRAGLKADGFVPYLVTPSQLESLTAVAREQRSTLNPAGSFQIGVSVLVVVGDSAADAERSAASAGQFSLSREMREKFVIAGTAAECASALLEYRRSGATNLIVNLAVSETEKLVQMKRFATEVLPMIRS